MQTKLLKGYKIYIASTELSYLKTTWERKPKMYARQLMYIIVGKKNLKLMTPTGRGNTPKIPKDVFKAVLSNLITNFTFPLHTSI